MDHDARRPALALRRLVNGYQVTQALHVAAVLGVADLLADGPRSSNDLAAATETHPGALYRLLRALASVGVFREEEDRRFALTELGACLRSDAPEPVGGWAAFVGEPYQWQAWGALLHSVRTGENAFRHVHGIDSWSYRARHPELSASFDRAMTSLSRQVVSAVLETYDFGRFGHLIDVGGGNGAVLATILAKNPTAHGVLFDQPHVVSGAGPILAAAGVADRCQVVGGSFFETVPAGATPISSKQSSMTGRTNRASRSCKPAAGRWLRERRCWSSSASLVGPIRTPTPSSPTSTCWSVPWARSGPRPSTPPSSPRPGSGSSASPRAR